jgi:hypothetical protein
MNIHIEVKVQGGGKGVAVKNEDGTEVSLNVGSATTCLRLQRAQGMTKIWRNGQPWKDDIVEDGDTFFWESRANKTIQSRRTVLFIDEGSDPIWTTPESPRARVRSFRGIHEARASVLRNCKMWGGSKVCPHDTIGIRGRSTEEMLLPKLTVLISEGPKQTVHSVSEARDIMRRFPREDRRYILKNRSPWDGVPPQDEDHFVLPGHLGIHALNKDNWIEIIPTNDVDCIWGGGGEEIN